MNPFQQVNRRDFLKLTSLAAAGTLVALTVKSQPAAAASKLDISISSNHGHVLVANAKSLFSNGPKTYSIKGSASHDHALTITQEILDTLQSTQVVDVDTESGAGHSHTVRLQII